MAQLNKAEEITSVWKALSATPQGDDGWMAMQVAAGARCVLKAGKHFPGGEEAVLAGFRFVTVPVSEQFPEGKGFTVRRVSLGQQNNNLTWVALQRLPAGSLEMFTMMAADVVSTLEGMSDATDDRVISAFLARVRAWQNFMQPGNEGVLGFESEVGLYGELEMLEALICAGIPADRALHSWVGPCGGIQDYVLGAGAIEVKTTTVAGTFPACISSLEQLDDSQCKPLFLAAVRISQIESGTTLPEKIESFRSIFETAAKEVLPDFDLRLLQAGYIRSFSYRYVRKFGDAAIRIIHVNNAVPRLVHATIPAGILRAMYEIDIDSIPAGDLTLEQALHSLGAF